MMDTDTKSRSTLTNVLCDAEARWPDEPFLHSIGEGECTRAEAYRSALRIAAGLRELGVREQQAVVVMSPTCLTAVHAWFGIACAGAIEVNVNGAYRGASLAHALNTAQAEVIVIEVRHLAELKACEGGLRHLRKVLHFRLPDMPEEPLPRFERIELLPFERVAQHAPLHDPQAITPRDIASLIYTSGTSGPAKAVRMPHAQLHFLASRTVDRLRITHDDIFYCCHPLFHMAGKFMGVLAVLMSGGSIVLDRAFRPESWLQRVRDHRATVSLAHGPMVEMIHAQPRRLDDGDHAMRRMLVVPFPRAIASDFEQRFNVRGIECWGMTEINAVCWTPYDEPLHPGSCGKVDDEAYDFRVIDGETDEEMPRGAIGEFVVRPKRPWIIMQGYHGMPEKTVEAWRHLWFHTGDAGYIDVDGYVYFVDRLGDRIRRRAENISSYDIECAALLHAEVAECAAVGVPSEFESDDDIKLCVVWRAGSNPAPEALLRHLATTLPHYMVPRYILTLEALPRTPTNKVQKARLRAAGDAPGLWDRKAANMSLRHLVAVSGHSHANPC